MTPDTVLEGCSPLVRRSLPNLEKLRETMELISKYALEIVRLNVILPVSVASSQRHGRSHLSIMQRPARNQEDDLWTG